MKKRIGKLILAAMMLLILPMSVLAAGLALPSFYGDTYYAVLNRMHDHLQQIPGPKVIVVGGSNVAFGLESELMEELLSGQGYSYTVCPFGLYAAVGTSAMLDLSRHTLREGDIVILAVEPTPETMSEYFGAEAFWKCAEDAPELIGFLGKEKQAALAGTYIPYLQTRYGILASGIPPAPQGVYAASSFNERCDLVYDRPGNLMAVGFDPSVRIHLDDLTISNAFSGQILSYCDYASKQGASVLLSFSPVNRSCITDLSEDAVESFFQTCNDAFPCPIISDPNRYILDSGWFYDSNFHLNSAGAKLRTALLTQDLLTWLGCYRELDYTLPEMPPSAVQMKHVEGDEDCFLFTPDGQGTGYLISGLSPTGLEKTQLQVPSAHEGRPVLGLTADALAEAQQLEELRIPESVAHLPGGLFRNAKKLTRLVLEHLDAPCGIEPETFRDADQIRIFVPAAAFPLYRDGYGCETNPWTPYLGRMNTYQISG